MLQMPLLLAGAIPDEDAIIMLASQQEKNQSITDSIVPLQRFNINALTDYEARFNFRFWKRDLYVLFESLALGEEYILSNGVKFTGFDGLCVVLRRLAYPGRYGDLTSFFGRRKSTLCMIFSMMVDIIYRKCCRLLTIESGLLTQSRLQAYAAAVARRGAPLQNCVGFIDGTVRGVARPSAHQRQLYNGHKRKHGLKYQGVMAPDGLFIDFYGPVLGRRHDSYMLSESGLLERLPGVLGKDPNGVPYCLYGDPAYPLKSNLMVGYKGANLNDDQAAFNTAMSKVRISVEWGFAGIVRLWQHFDLRSSQKLYLSPVAKNYLVGVILTNCRNCASRNQISSFFDVKPPTLQEYIGLLSRDS